MSRARPKQTLIEMESAGASWAVVPMMRAIGASERLLGSAPASASDVKSTKLTPRDRRVFADFIETTDLYTRRDRKDLSGQYADLFKKFAKLVSANTTIVSVGSSPDKLAFMAELAGSDVRYLAFSRELFWDKGVEGVFVDAQLRTQLCRRFRAMLSRARVSLKELRDPEREFLFVDKIDTGISIVTLLELIGVCLKIPDLTGRTSVVLLASPDLIDVHSERTLTRHAFKKVTFLAATDGSWALSKATRCVPKARLRGMSAYDEMDSALCNAVRLWLAHCVVRNVRRPKTKRPKRTPSKKP